MLAEQGIEIDDLTEEGGQELLVRLSLYGTCHAVKVIRNVLLDSLLAEGIAVVLLGVGFTCQPFRCRFQSFRNRHDEDRSFRINAACLVSLNGRFVYAQTVSELAHAIDIVLDNGADGPTVTVDGQDRTRAIRTPEVDANVSAVAAVPAVREAMVALQRQAAESADVVAEGRDIGTVVFPAAEVKVFLSADASARARRRAVQRHGGDTATDANATANAEEQARIEAELIARDKADSTRETAPLKPAEDAVRIDSTDLTVDEVCDAISKLIAGARA